MCSSTNKFINMHFYLKMFSVVSAVSPFKNVLYNFKVCPYLKATHNKFPLKRVERGLGSTYYANEFSPQNLFFQRYSITRDYHRFPFVLERNGYEIGIFFSLESVKPTSLHASVFFIFFIYFTSKEPLKR